MPKNKTLKHDELIADDYVEDFSSPEEEDGFDDLMIGLIEASIHQQKIALELTKLVIEKSTTTMNDEKIISFYPTLKISPGKLFLKNYLPINLLSHYISLFSKYYFLNGQIN